MGVPGTTLTSNERLVRQIVVHEFSVGHVVSYFAQANSVENAVGASTLCGLIKIYGVVVYNSTCTADEEPFNLEITVNIDCGNSEGVVFLEL